MKETCIFIMCTVYTDHFTYIVICIYIVIGYETILCHSVINHSLISKFKLFIMVHEILQLGVRNSLPAQSQWTALGDLGKTRKNTTQTLNKAAERASSWLLFCHNESYHRQAVLDPHYYPAFMRVYLNKG
ncbi:hypothetical protein ACF0H5_012865 [Mactra antiquata]